MIRVEVNRRSLELMVDCGASFTCIRPEDAIHLPMSGQLVRTIGFEGMKQLIPLTKPVELRYKNQKIVIPILVSECTPVALLGRDALCKLNCTIRCTPDGCQVDMPNTARQLLATMDDHGPVVFWVGDLSSSLLKPIEKWEAFIEANMPGTTSPECPLHCTLKYFKNDTHLDPEKWQAAQPKQVLISASFVILGPQGVAMRVDKNDYLDREFEVSDSVPHITLRVTDGCRPKDLGPMMKAADVAVFTPMEEHPDVYRSVDHRFLRITIAGQGQGQPQAVCLTHETICSAKTDQEYLMDEMLSQVPEFLWSQHSTDIGLVKSAQPVTAELRPGTVPPWKSQYPLKEDAVRGIGPQIKGLVQAGVLRVIQNPQSNTPLLPVKKPDNTYRLAHDLRAVNEIVVDFPADVPDPHTLLAQVPPEASYFTVIDLCGAFFSVPLSIESQGLFGFTYNGQHYEYLRLPQGFKHSPHIFNKILKEDLDDVQHLLTSTVIQYVDDIIICSPDRETCHKDSVKFLQLLAEKGHKASQKKLQYCVERVVYLGQAISKGHRCIADNHLEAIRNAPKPRTVREMMTFLGIAGYSSAWIEDYAGLAGPLRAMIKETGDAQLHGNLTWTTDALQAFETVKQRLQEAPALALPDYSRNFLLFVSTSTGGKYACAVLSQPTGTGTSPQPIAYYSTAYSGVEMGLPPCFRALVGAYLMYEKASSVTMGYPVTILCHHSLRNLLNYGKYTLTMPRLRDYHRLLEQEDVTVVRCTTANPAENLPTSEDGEPHDCLREADRYSKLRSDLQALPLHNPEVEYWTDGSCYRLADGLSAGYAIVESQGSDFVVVKAETIPQPASAQLAELVGLTEACLLAEGKKVTIYTDSAYAHNVCHLFGAVWKSRGFKKTNGSPIQHHAQIMKLLQAMMKPKELAIAKCAAHKTDQSRITRGNKVADEAAKAVTGADRPGKVFLVTQDIDVEKNVTLQDVVVMQNEASPLDRQLWMDRGAAQDPSGLWRNHEGLVVAPPDLLGLMIQEAHGLAHVARGEVKRKITKEYGFWAPYLLEQIDYVIGRCAICLKNNVRRGVTVPPGYVPTPKGPMRELVIDFVDMIRPVEGKRYMLVVVDRFSRWTEACPTRRKDAQSVAKFLCREVISRWGLPDRISSDNGREFVDRTIKLTLQKLGIKQRLGSVYHPQSQGICERMNGVLKNRIAKICQHTGLNWVAALPLALMACRSGELRDLHLTPHELVTGRRMPTPCWRTCSKGPSLAPLEDEMRAYVNYLAILHKRISTYVSDRQTQEEAQQKLEEQRSATVQPGDKVFVKVFRRKWFDERRQGPFEVVRCSGTAVQVKGSPTWYHLSHCVKAQSAVTPRPQACPGKDGAGTHDDPENPHPVGDVGATAESPSAGGASDTPERHRRQHFETIDCQYLPAAGTPELPSRPSRGALARRGRGRIGPTTRSASRNAIASSIRITRSHSKRSRGHPHRYGTRSKSSSGN